MKTISLLTCALLCLASLSARADDKKQTPDELGKAMVTNMNAVVDVIETIKDNASADLAIAKLKKVSKLEDLAKEFFKLSVEEKKKLQEKYKDEMEKTTKRMQAALKNVEAKVSAEKALDVAFAAGMKPKK